MHFRALNHHFFLVSFFTPATQERINNCSEHLHIFFYVHVTAINRCITYRKRKRTGLFIFIPPTGCCCCCCCLSDENAFLFSGLLHSLHKAIAALYRRRATGGAKHTKLLLAHSCGCCRAFFFIARFAAALSIRLHTWRCACIYFAIRSLYVLSDDAASCAHIARRYNSAAAGYSIIIEPHA